MIENKSALLNRLPWLKTEERFSFKKSLRKWALELLNRRQSRLYLAYRPDFDADFRRLPGAELLSWWTRGVAANNYGDFPRLYSIFLNFQSCMSRCPDGAIAELGVYKGNSAKLFREWAPHRSLYLFDTFAGFHGKDLNAESGHVNAKAFTDTSLTYVQNFVGTDKNTIYCQGRFPETAALVPPSETFAFVHIDMDLYAPTISALEFFYPRMVAGGMLLIHDYTNEHWPGVKKAVDQFLTDKEEYPVLLPDKSGSAVIAVRNGIRAQT